MINKIKEIINGLNEAEKERLIKDGYTNEAFFINGALTEQFKFKVLEKSKYFYINQDRSGVFMIDKQGEIFNIKAYGQPDRNKKIKANLGNINDYDSLEKIKILYSKRWNYLK